MSSGAGCAACVDVPRRLFIAITYIKSANNDLSSNPILETHAVYFEPRRSFEYGPHHTGRAPLVPSQYSKQILRVSRH